MNLTDVYRIDFEALGVENIKESLKTIKGIEEVTKALNKELKETEKGTQAYQGLAKAVALLKNEQKALTNEQNALQKSLVESPKAATGSYRDLNSQLVKLRATFKELSATERDGALGKSILAQIQPLDTKLKGIDASLGQFQRNVGNYGDAITQAFSSISPSLGQLSGQIQGLFSSTSSSAGGAISGINLFSVALIGVGVAAAGISKALEVNAKISDLKAAVARTAELTKDQIDGLVESLKKLDTRTSLDDLLKISLAAGKLGVTGKENVLAFTQAIDVLAVSLGDEFSGGAEEVSNRIGKLSTVFFGAEKNGVKLSNNILNIGNALNVLADAGNASADGITELASRIGKVGVPFGLTQGYVLGLSATLDELNVSAEVGGTSIGKLLGAITSDRAKFAKVLGLDLKEFTDLLNNDLDGALSLVIGRVSELGKTNTDLSDILKAVGIDGQNNVQTLLALGKNQDLLSKSVDSATKSLTNQDSVKKEFRTQNETLGASLDKLKNSFDNAFVNSGAESAFKGILDTATAIVPKIFELGKGLALFVAPAQAMSAIYAQLSGNIKRDKQATDANQKAFAASETAKLFKRDGVKDTDFLLTKNPLNPNKKGLNLAGKANLETDEQSKAQVRSAKKERDTAFKLSEELEEIEKVKTKAISKIQNDAAKSRADAIDDQLEREIAKENERSQATISELQKRGEQEIETRKNALQKLKRDPTANKSDLLKLEKATKQAEIEIQSEANKQIESEQLDHARKIESIKDAAAKREKAAEKKKAAEAIADQKANFTLLQDLVKSDFAKIDEDSAERLKKNSQDKIAALEKTNGIGNDKQRTKIQTEIEFQFTIADFDEQQRALQAKFDEIKSKIESANLLNNIAVDNGEALPFSTSDLEKFAIESQKIQKQITENDKKELDARSKNLKSTNAKDIAEERKKREQLQDAAFKGAEIVANGIFDLKRTGLEAEKEEAIRILDAEYAAKLDAAKGNSVETLRIEKEFKEKKREIEIQSIEDNANLAKSQALIGASLAVIQTLASPIGFPANIIAAGLIGIKTDFEVANIDAQASKQIAALRAEEGTIISLSGANVQKGKVIEGKRHSEGGENLIANGRFVNAEQGEYIDTDESGNVVILSRAKTAKFKPFLERMSGFNFVGKGEMLRGIHNNTISLSNISQRAAMPKNSGRMMYKAEDGAIFAPSSFSGGQGTLNVNTTAQLSDAQIDVLARRIATSTGAAVQSGVIQGSQESNRIAERTNAAVENATI